MVNSTPVFTQDTCHNPSIYITENGFAQVGPVDLEDTQRCGFYQDTLLEVSKGTPPWKGALSG